jgi:hypothetical protein
MLSMDRFTIKKHGGLHQTLANKADLVKLNQDKNELCNEFQILVFVIIIYFLFSSQQVHTVYSLLMLRSLNPHLEIIRLNADSNSPLIQPV